MLRRPLRVLMVSSEVETFARTGGLGDVVLGLSRALSAHGVEVVIVTPRYGITPLPHDVNWWAETVQARVGWGPHDVRDLGVAEVFVAERARVCLLDHGELFGDRGGIYADANGTFGDNELRFATLSRAALAVAERVWGPADGFDSGPDVIHAHDWHAALSIVYARLAMGEAWSRVPSVFTVHNLAFQGVLGFGALDELGIPRVAYHADCLEHQGLVNLLKGALACSNVVTTVSPTYAREILAPWNGFGLADYLRSQGDKLMGIVNGIDPERFDPRNDRALPQPYGSDDLAAAHQGRRAAKDALFGELGLDDSNAPLFATVSRLTWQKGIDMLLAIVPALVGRGARIAMVGTGEPEIEDAMRRMAARFPGRVGVRIAFDESLARRLYAASDFFVVPSRYEPCGLTQLYAMRYGSIPIVTNVGGLHDTIRPYDGVHEQGNGFLAASVDSGALLVACQDAFDTYWDPVGMRGLVERAMTEDATWERSAEEYLDRVYLPLIDRVR
jgi:starch synthase